MFDELGPVSSFGLREDVFFTYCPSEEALAGEELRLAPLEEHVPPPPAIPSSDEVQQALAPLEPLRVNGATAERLAAALEQIAAFLRAYDPAGPEGRPFRSSLAELGARAAAAESAYRNVQAATKLARAVYCDGSSQFLDRFMQALQFHLEGAPPGSPIFSALLEVAAETARLEVLADSGLAVDYYRRALPVGPSEAEKYLGDEERIHSAVHRVRLPQKKYERFGPVAQGGLPLVEELANAARDWARSELHYAACFGAPVLTAPEEVEKRYAELAQLDSAVKRIRSAAWSLAEQLARKELSRPLSDTARTLCARLTNTEKRHVAASVSEELVRRAEAERNRRERIALLQKRLARMSSHPSILYAPDERARQEAAYVLACEMADASPQGAMPRGSA